MLKAQPNKLLLISTALGVLTYGSANAAASLAIEEITVTATKMGETRLQDTPLAITAFSGNQIEKTGLKDVRDLMSLTPNLMISQNTSMAQIYIRGVGSNNVFPGSDPSSTLHLDGVYLARPAAQLQSFLDVERVEVLRGPQGTLYGRNSVGGTINIISRKPDSQIMAKVQGTYGNYNQVRGEGYISGPLIEDKLAASLSALYSSHDGYRKNIVASGNDSEEEDMWMTRAQVRATPSDRLELLLRADYMKSKGVPSSAVKLLELYEPVVDSTLGDFGKIALNTPGHNDSYQWGVSGEVKIDINENFTLTSITAYRKNKLELSADTDSTSLSLLYTDLGERQDQLTQELNLSGRIERLKYVLGLYYIDEDIFTDSAVNNPVAGIRAGLKPVVNTKAWAAYGQATYDLTDQFSVTAGIRYTDENKEFHQNFQVSLLANGVVIVGPLQPNLEDTYKAWTPKFGLEFKASEDVLLYASMTRGFKSGGYNFSTGSTINGYDPEYLWSYEAGFKSDLLNKQLRLNGSLFYYDYTDLQVQSFIVPGSINITNAANASVKGFELEMLARPTEGLDIGATLAILDSKYKDFAETPLPYGGGIVSATGNRLSSAPKWAYSLYSQYTFPVADAGDIFLRGEYSWKDRQYFTPDNSLIQSQESFGVLHASMGFSSADSHWQVIAYGRNLTNKEYVISTVTFSPRVAGHPGEPRTYGLRVIYQY